MRILLIEDNPDHVFLARQAIEEVWRGASLHVAHGFSEAKTLLQKRGRRTHFDLLLAALDSHDVQRLAQLRELQTFPQTKATPVIALVGSTRDRELAQVAHHPAEWILLKPLRAEALREAIQRRPLP